MKKKVLDVTKDKCPITFLKAKNFISSNIGFEKTILIKGKKISKCSEIILKKILKKTKKNSQNIYELIFT